MSGPLKNGRHEKFAQLLAKGMSAMEAYRQAGYKTTKGNDGSNAARLSGNERVAARVAEIKEAVANRMVVTQASLIKELEVGQAMAVQEKSPSAHIQATAVKARITGHWTAERKNERPALLEDVPDSQLDDAVRSLAKQAGATIELRTAATKH